jgi:hypothetical protein
MGKAWELVCDKRSECNCALENIPGVAFFFSAISSRENHPTKKGKKTTENNGADEEDEEENIPSSQRTLVSDASRSSAINTAVEKGRLPAISYWVAFESPNGTPISLVQMHRGLLQCEVEIDTKILTTRSGASGDITKRLCMVLKDHNSSYIGDIVNASFQTCFQEAIQDIDQRDSLEDAEEAMRERVLRFVIVKAMYAKEMKSVIEALERAGLQLDVEGLDLSSDGDRTSALIGKVITADQCTQLINDVEILMKRLRYAMYKGTVYKKNPRAMYTYTYKCTPCTPTSALIGKVITADQCTQLINDVEVLMKRLRYAIYKGTVYKKNPRAMYTYTYKCEVSAFVGTLEGNESFKARLVKYGDKLRDKLKNPNSQLIHQIEVCHDLIEVNEGWCLSLSGRKFVKQPIALQKVGQISPLAFYEYDHKTTPDAKFFREILENSLSPDDISSFCDDFLNLLQFQNKRHKQKVSSVIALCL